MRNQQKNRLCQSADEAALANSDINVGADTLFILLGSYFKARNFTGN